MVLSRRYLSGSRLVKTANNKFKCPAEDLLSKGDSHKLESCRELDRLINELTHAEEEYLPLTEHGFSFLAEKEKVTITIKNLRKEVANLKSELIKNNNQIASLNERHKKILNVYEILLKKHAILNKDYILLEQENRELDKLAKLFKEIEELSKKIRMLYEEIEKLKKKNELLSCLLTPMSIIGYNFQIYVLHPLLELNI
ncbi:2313_t:CDS:2 [Cetraspora pellucida]|uniref:2313_t:CDS:1 n=1 Tax=Cetraspora pellucida TaxID=1433469 RepID=A0A9N8ZDA9_9GLOM|nr:2313_t:CDS:2 [Cetraspora pellucida]